MFACTVYCAHVASWIDSQFMHGTQTSSGMIATVLGHKIDHLH